MKNMTIACTRCGATCEGDIIVPPLAFGFKHKSGCGHGVGPLAVLPGKAKSKFKEEYHKVEGKKTERIVFDEAKEIVVNKVKKEKNTERKVEKFKPYKQ